MRIRTHLLFWILIGLIVAGCSNAGSTGNAQSSPTSLPASTATPTPTPTPSLGDLLPGKWSAKLQPPTQEVYLVASYYEFLESGIVIKTSVYSDGRESTSSAEFQVVDETRIRLVTPLASEVWTITFHGPDNLALTYPNNATVEYERVSP